MPQYAKNWKSRLLNNGVAVEVASTLDGESSD
jgi:hypothetical protein